MDLVLEISYCTIRHSNILTTFAKFLTIKYIVKLRFLVSQTEWTNISERNSNLIENLKKGPKLTLKFKSTIASPFKQIASPFLHNNFSVQFDI